MPGINIVLEATSHPEFGDIHIHQPLYPIGREEQAFASMDANVRSKLSRRHARLFVEDHKAYLTDLDSSNGTMVNDKALPGGSPRVVHDGDLLTFSGEISYRARLIDMGAVTEAEHATDEKLILQPTNPEGQLDTLVITQFPFLIGRKDSVLEAYSERFPDETAHLSRRHAIITAQGDIFHIEDLGSKNGTEVNGIRLDDHSKPLSHGDSVSFGNNFFVYTVELPTVSETPTAIDSPGAQSTVSEADNPALADASRDREKTLFVDSPASFLEIFCGEEHSADADENIEQAEGQDAGSQQGEGRPGPVQSAGNKARAIGDAFMGERVSRPPISKPLILGMAAVFVLAVAIFLYPGEKDRIDSAFENGDYLQSARLANAYLADHPHDSQVEEKGTRAILKALLPKWLNHLQQGAYAKADQVLEEHHAPCVNIPDALDALHLLRWIGDLDQFMAENDGPSGPIDIFEDERDMAPILETWDRSPNRHQQILSFISSVEPDFEPVQKEAMSRIRQLDHSFNSHEKALSSLADTTLEAIDSEDMKALYVEIADNRKNFPRLRGLDRLEDDAKLYETRLGQLKEADIGVLVTMQRELDFQTDIFRKNAMPRIIDQLPDNQVSITYTRAIDAWHQGNSDAAIRTLREMASDDLWSDKVGLKIDRFENVATEYASLQANVDAQDYPEKLLDFRGRLDPAEDIYYLEATSSSFEAYKGQLLQVLQEQYQSAQRRWTEYETAGGISSIMRIEDPISESFTEQCTRLELSLISLNAILETYGSLRVQVPDYIAELNQIVNKEVMRQRSWINDLAVVLDEELLHEKLILLPNPEEATSP